MQNVFLLLLLLVYPVSTGFNETSLCSNITNPNFTEADRETNKAFVDTLDANVTEGFEGAYVYGYCLGLNIRQGAEDAINNTEISKYIDTLQDKKFNEMR